MSGPAESGSVTEMDDPVPFRALRIADITVPDRLRRIDAAWVEALAASIAESGLKTPIEVAPNEGGYILVAGAHRLAASQRLGHETIPARVSLGLDDDRRLAEIDENLMRRELAPLDRAVFLAERKALYERLHPEAKQGGDRKSADFKAENQTDTMSVWSFSRDTAQRIGFDERTIRRSVRIATRIPPRVRDLIALTDAAGKQSELLQLARYTPEEQASIATTLAAGECRSVAAAAARLHGHPAPTHSERERQIRALMKAWMRASRRSRRQFLSWLADNPQEDAALLDELLADRAGGRDG